jgi:hypothetical protein
MAYWLFFFLLAYYNNKKKCILFVLINIIYLLYKSNTQNHDFYDHQSRRTVEEEF